MMLANATLLQRPIVFHENQANVLIIEDAVSFRQAVISLTEQCAGNDGPFVLSQNEIEQRLSTNAIILTDVLSLDMSSRKITTGVNRLATSVAMDFSDELYPLMYDLNAVGARIVSRLDMPVTYSYVDTPEDIVKTLGFRVDLSEMGLPEKLLEYMKIQREFTGINFFIFVNLKSFLSEEELFLFYKDVFYNKLTVLLLESFQREGPRMEEDIRIIDKDLCEI